MGRARTAAVGFVLAAIGLLGPPAAAREASLASACQLDFQLFCSQVDPESPRSAVEGCLREHMASLTESCRAVLDPATVPTPAPEAPSGPLAACAPDFARLCREAADRYAAARCLLRERTSLSPACRDALEAATRNRGGFGPGAALP